ncbi:Mss4-like protein [Aspergillus alliaceus]|uniref:Mss4-like protein n=1 Tax=Petromyces alliaceus TaxID=209559 RepID=A0A5N7CJ10_PETAA|nr:Mss4-like protein [Aspergillus alliaceus]
MAAKSLTGACLCQKITYRIDLPADTPTPKVAICHCNGCKRNSGSAFSTNVIIPKPTFTYTAGSPKVYVDTTGESGNAVQKHFCGDCGTPLNAQPDGKGVVVVKAGTLDEEPRGELELAIEIFCKRREAWVDQIGSVPKTDGMM